jgi:hypothetical protein
MVKTYPIDYNIVYYVIIGFALYYDSYSSSFESKTDPEILEENSYG